MATINTTIQALGWEVAARLDSNTPFAAEPPELDWDGIDAVICNGEGTMHHGADAATFWLRLLQAAKDSGRRTALINTVWDTMPTWAHDIAHGLDLIITRDPLSTLQLAYHGTTCHQLIDLSLLPNPRRPTAPIPVPDAHGAEIWWGRTWVRDPVGAATLAGYANAGPRFDVPASGPGAPFDCGIDALKTSGVQCYITGQFHGLCIALAAGVPVLPIPGNCHKIEGMLRWSGLPVPLWDERRHYRSQIHAARAVSDDFVEWAGREVERAEDLFPELLGGLVK